MIDPVARLQALSRFRVRQRFTGMVNSYEIRTWDADGPGDVLAVAVRKQQVAAELVTFFADEARTIPAFGFKPRAVLDVHSLTDVVDAGGVPIGTFRKDSAASLMRAHWYLEQPGSEPAEGIERNVVTAVIRRYLLEFLPYHFDFARPDGSKVMTVDKGFAFMRDAYDVEVQDASLDRRLAAVMAVALDSFQAR